MNKTPKISVIMSAYNRANFVKNAIESILNQTYKDFEFIIIDDCSTDNTAEVIQSYANKDERIVFIKNEKNMDYNHNLRKGVEIAKGEYLARMDDDDISLPARFEKQVDFMDKNPDITVLGTFIELFGEDNIDNNWNWIKETNPDALALLMNFQNPMCHPSVMIRNSFLKKYNLNYHPKALYAEEYHLWKEIIIRGGKLANLPEVLVEYRFHKNSVTQKRKTSKIQAKTANKVKIELLKRFFKFKKVAKKVMKKIISYPFHYNNAKKLYDVLQEMRKNNAGYLKNEAFEIIEEKYCGKPCTMEIFFAADDKFAQHLCVSIASILNNSLPFEEFNFYILDGGITQKNKDRIKQLKKSRHFNIEFIKIDAKIVDCCPITSECQHISKQTYYRFLIPRLKPELEKCLYFDCDIVVEDSLNKFWHMDLEDNYVAAVEELYESTSDDIKRLGLKNMFNAGVIFINNKKWIEDNITEQLFNNTTEMIKKDLIKWVDQDVLNYTFKNKIKWISPKYNLQQNAFYNGQHSLYSNEEMDYAKENPIIIHYNGHLKPWSKKCRHPLYKKYYKYLILTPFKSKYYGYKCKDILRGFLNSIFSIKKEGPRKIIKILGIKIKIKHKAILNANYTVLIQNSNLFDEKWYLHSHPKVRASKLSPLEHYLKNGWKIGLNPSQEFDGNTYLKIYQNVKDNPLGHFLNQLHDAYNYGFFKDVYKASDENIQSYLNIKATRISKKVVYTCITGDYNVLPQHKFINNEWDYICFTDNQKTIELKQVGIWEIKPLIFDKLDNVRNNRYHKVNYFECVSDYDESIYIDANINVKTPYLFEQISTKQKNLLMPVHQKNNCSITELAYFVNSGCDPREIIKNQIKLMEEAEFPKNYGMSENCIIYRKHDEKNKKIMQDWWYFIENYCQRDQGSFSFVLWKNDIKIKDTTITSARIDLENYCFMKHSKEYEWKY